MEDEKSKSTERRAGDITAGAEPPGGRGEERSTDQREGSSPREVRGTQMLRGEQTGCTRQGIELSSLISSVLRDLVQGRRSLMD